MQSVQTINKIGKIAITGDLNFLRQRRFSLLFEALAEHADDLQLVSVNNIYDSKWLKKLTKVIIKNVPLPISTDGRASAFRKRTGTYIKQSIECEEKIYSLENLPDFIFHLFGMYCPSWHYSDIPFSMYLDYTMALASRTWQPWTPFAKQEDLLAWQACERKAYQKASCIFTFSRLVKQSLIDDYGIDHYKIFPVGASGQFLEPYSGSKTFGSCKILFNGSNFERKGGHLVVSAFEKIKAAVPAAELIVVGDEISSSSSQSGIRNMGLVTDASAMRQLFLDADILLAPALCEPYGQMLVEAINYGLPVIVSDVGGMPEIIDHGINGLVMPELNSDCLAESVIGLIEDKARLEHFSEQGRHKVKEQLNWPSIAREMHFQISDVLGRKRL